MQEVTSTTSDLGNSFDQMRTSALVDLSSQSRAFSDFMRLGSQSSQSSTSSTTTNAAASAAASAVNPAATVSAAAPVVNTVNSVIQSAPLNTSTNTAAASAAAATLPTVGTGVQNLFAQINSAADTVPTQPLVQSDTASTLATTVSTASSTTRVASKNASTTTSSSKNTPVSRTAFEKSKALLAKAGLSETEIEDLSGRVQAGTLTWGQLAQTLGAHTAGAKKSVELSADETADLQSMFQKMGFAGADASAMVKSVASGDGLKVLSAIQNKLSTTTDDSTFGFNASELSTFFKALRVPEDTAAKLSQKLAGDTATAADMKNALATISQTMQEQRTKATANDAEVAKGLAKIMEKDVAKNARDTTSTTTAATSSSSGQVPYDLKTKDRNDTSWFNDHEKTQQQTSDDAWSKFTSKVRTDDSGTQQNGTGTGSGANAGTGGGTGTGTGTGSTGTGHTVAQTSGKESLDAAISRSAQSLATAQTGTSTTQAAKGFEQVTAPKVLDQVTQAMLKDLGQGRKQLTVELDPDNLGKVQVMLQVKGKEVTAVISAEDSGTAAMLQSNMEGLRKSLEDKGLTVQSMEVQTGLASRQDQQAAFNAEQHNQQAQDQQDMSRIFSQMRMMRADSGDAALDMQNTDMQAILADQGLHLIA